MYQLEFVNSFHIPCCVFESGAGLKICKLPILLSLVFDDIEHFQVWEYGYW